MMDYGKARALELITRGWLKERGRWLKNLPADQRAAIAKARKDKRVQYQAEYDHAQWTEEKAERMTLKQSADEQRPEFLAAVAYLTNRQLRIFPIGEFHVPTSTTECDDEQSVRELLETAAD